MLARRMRVVLLLLMIMLIGSANEGSLTGVVIAGVVQQEAAPEQMAARDWLNAVAELNGTQILKYTCLAQRNNIREFSSWMSALPNVGSMIERQPDLVKGDAADLQFETFAQTETAAQVLVTGEIRVAVFAVGDAVQLTEQWLLIQENGMWRWCGAVDSNLSLPYAERVNQIAPPLVGKLLRSGNNTDSTSESDLKYSIVGTWKAQSAGARNTDPAAYLTFLPDGSFIDVHGEFIDYEVYGENTFSLGRTGGIDTFRITNRSTSEGDQLTIALDGEETILRRVPGIPDLDQTIVGQWQVNSEAYASLEFAPNGWARLGTQLGRYQVVSPNTLRFETADSDIINIYVTESSGSAMSLFYGGRNHAATRVATQQEDLADEILGTWLYEGGEAYYEFVQDGYLVVSTGPLGESFVSKYEVFSNSTIILNLDGSEIVVQVVDISDDTLSLYLPEERDLVEFTRKED